jgi:hypothetical protein
LCTPSLAPTAVFAQSRTVLAQSSKPVITLVNEAPDVVGAITPVKGEASFAHAPANFHAFASAAVGQDTIPERLTLSFAASTTLTEIKSTKDFEIDQGSTCIEQGYYSAGETCSLLIRFTPQGPGRRLGKLTIANTASAEPAAIGLGGNGYAPVVSFTPAVISTVPGTYPSGTGLLTGAHTLAVGGDILYVADTGHTLIREIDSSGNISNVTPVAVPESIAVDSFGYVYTVSPGSSQYFSYYNPTGGYTWYFNTYAAGTCTVSAPCNLGTVGMGNPQSLSMDPNNNLFLEEQTKGAMEASVGDVAGYEGLSPPINVWYLQDDFAPFTGAGTALSVNANDDLFTAYSYGTNVCDIVEEAAYEAEGTSTPSYTRVAGGSRCGYSGDGGQGSAAEISTSIGQIAFDIAGNLYFTDSGNQRVREINAVTGIINTIAGNGTAGYTGDGGAATSAELNSPTGVAVDSQGQVYIVSSATSGQVIRKIGTTGLLSFGSQLKGSASAAHLVTVSNTGNSTLQLTNAVITGTNASAFKVDPNTTSCLLTAGSYLDAGESCQVGIIFTPSAAGSFTANFVLLDNTVTNSNTVQLTGTGALPSPLFKITSPASGASFTSGTAVTFSVSVTGSGTQPTGTVQFKVDGTDHGSAVTLSSGTASTSVTGLSVASHTLSATYSGDSNYSAAGPISVSITVKAAAVAKLASLSNPSPQCKPAAFSITVTGTGAVKPTGKVLLTKGSTVLADGTLSEGKATVSTSALTVGKNMLSAHYEGDTRFSPATSAPFAQTISVCTPSTPAKPQ